MRLLRELFPNGRSEVISVCLALLLTPFVFHFMMTGSPIPLWNIQELNGAVKVKTATHSALILEDDREIQLPFIKRIPSEDPLFLASMKEGIEINENGRVYGLLWAKRLFGNDATWWYRFRFDLSELAGAINPEGIDENQLLPGVKEILCQERYVRNSEQNPLYREMFDVYMRHNASGW